jgi:hypothetical protein
MALTALARTGLANIVQAHAALTPTTLRLPCRSQDRWRLAPTPAGRRHRNQRTTPLIPPMSLRIPLQIMLTIP